mmetsp:Transcript_853/g.2406  ORF Transcript_853/g.2406 Transcript_853/m.2406 type:complete len:280 (-) Transcript_853:386-1225(-)
MVERGRGGATAELRAVAGRAGKETVSTSHQNTKSRRQSARAGRGAGPVSAGSCGARFLGARQRVLVPHAPRLEFPPQRPARRRRFRGASLPGPALERPQRAGPLPRRGVPRRVSGRAARRRQRRRGLLHGHGRILGSLRRPKRRVGRRVVVLFRGYGARRSRVRRRDLSSPKAGRSVGQLRPSLVPLGPVLQRRPLRLRRRPLRPKHRTRLGRTQARHPRPRLLLRPLRVPPRLPLHRQPPLHAAHHLRLPLLHRRQTPLTGASKSWVVVSSSRVTTNP